MNNPVKDSNKVYKKSFISIKGANVHNLKNVDLTIPKNQLVVFTGVSGSGKTSLCIDTLFAEGQRRYVESLSSYARQFLSRMNKPDVSYIKGLCPAIAIDQKVSGKSTRASVGSLTEIYDYLRVLFARAGSTYSPKSGRKVKKDEITDVVNFVQSLPKESKVVLTYPLHIRGGWHSELNLLIQKGFTRLSIENTLVKIESLLEEKAMKGVAVEVVVDRVVLNGADDLAARVADSAQTCFYESQGDCFVKVIDGELTKFNNRFEADGMTFEEPNTQFFNFNSPFGACKNCEGFGSVIGIDDDLVIPNKRLSVFEDAVVCWKGEKMKEWKLDLIRNAERVNFPIHRPIKDLTKKELKMLWEGTKHFGGINDFFKHVEQQTYKIQYRVMLSRYRGRTKCPACKGARLRHDVAYVQLGGKSISELLTMPIQEVNKFFDNIELDNFEQQVAERILIEINNRLDVLCEVGLGYLTLNRMAYTPLWWRNPKN